MKFIFICLFLFVPFILATAQQNYSLDHFNSCGLTNLLVYSFLIRFSPIVAFSFNME